MSARQFGWYDDWKTAILTCPTCGWTGTFNEGESEQYDALMDSSCPRCPWLKRPMLAIVSYPTTEEMEANRDKLTAREREFVENRKRFLADFEATALNSPDALPDLPGSELVLSWDFAQDGDGKKQTVIRHGETIVWSERAVWEGADRFEAVVGILRQKYGERLVDLVPTDASKLYLYGDHPRYIEAVERVRAELGGSKGS